MSTLLSFSFNSTLGSKSFNTLIETFKYPLTFVKSSDSGFAKANQLFFKQ